MFGGNGLLLVNLSIETIAELMKIAQFRLHLPLTSLILFRPLNPVHEAYVLTRCLLGADWLFFMRAKQQYPGK